MTYFLIVENMRQWVYDLMEQQVRINSRIIVRDVLTTDLHMHTVYCDGHNTPEEMILSAIEKGMTCIGFSGHSFVETEPELGMNEDENARYIAEIAGLKEKYSGKIRILCGIEQDYLSGKAASEYDYVIGSVHYIDTPEGPAAVDDTPEILKNAVEKYYNGDYYLAAENYFLQTADVIRQTGADIIGHFDLFSKFNQKENLFEEKDPRYVSVWKEALDKLLLQDKVFEINTGAMSRGWRDIPYPNPDMIKYIREKGGRFIYSSDSHTMENIGFAFPKSSD